MDTLYIKDSEIAHQLAATGSFLEKRVQDLVAQVLQAYKLVEDTKKENDVLRVTIEEKNQTIAHLRSVMDHQQLLQEYEYEIQCLREELRLAKEHRPHTMEEPSPIPDADPPEVALSEQATPEPEPMEPVRAPTPEAQRALSPDGSVVTEKAPRAPTPEPESEQEDENTPVQETVEDHVEDPVENAEEEEPEVEEEALELCEKTIKGVTYYVSLKEDQTIYECLEEGEVGAAVGRIEKVDGKSKVKWF